MDKDVLTRLAAIEDKLDVLIRHVPRDVTLGYEIDFSTVDGDRAELRRVYCTLPPMRGD